MTLPSPPRLWLHELKHRLGWHGCDLVEVIHEPTCPGFCGIGYLRGSTPKVCNVKLRWRCRECGKDELA
jgi:hypothetical protein